MEPTALENHHSTTQIMLMSTLLLPMLMNKNIDLKPNPHQPDTEREELLEMPPDLPHENDKEININSVCGESTVTGTKDNKSTNFVQVPRKY